MKSTLSILSLHLVLALTPSLLLPSLAEAAPVEPIHVRFSRLPPAAQQRILNISAESGFAGGSLVRINESELATATVVNLQLPGGPSVSLTRTDLTTDASGFTWTGVDAATGADARFVVEGTAVFARFSTATDVYSTRNIQAMYYALVRHDPTALPAEHGPEFAATEARPVTLDLVYPSVVFDPNTDVVIDLMIGYTDASSAWAGSDDHAVALAREAVAELNEANRNSGVHLEVNLVHIFETTYNESGTFTDLERLITPDDGHVDQAHTLRDQYRADVVILLADNDDYCGAAADILPSADRAFAVVDPSCASNNRSLAHEFGHILGARHNLAADGGLDPYAFGHGHVVPGMFRTIMGYGADLRINYWSNPAISYMGIPTGVIGQADNASVLNLTAYTVSQYRAPGLEVVLEGGTSWDSANYATATAFGDVDGDGFDEVVITRDADSGPRYWVLDDAIHGFVTLHMGGDNWGGGNHATSVATGDIDGDGLDEITIGRWSWENERFFVLDDAIAGFTTLFESGDAWALESGVQAVAMGDIDADGVDELIVGRDSDSCGSGCPRVLIYDDAIMGFALLGSVASTWGDAAILTDLATGDVDGDGDAEIGISRDTPLNGRYFVLDGPSTGFHELLAGGSTWDSTVGATAIAMGDADGDGRDEIAVGRTENPDARWIVLDDAWTNFLELHEGADDWGSLNATTGLDFGDVDADGVDELAVSRNAGGNARYFIQDDALHGFDLMVSGGETWGPGAYATDITLGDPDDDGHAEVCVTRFVNVNGRYFIVETGL